MCPQPKFSVFPAIMMCFLLCLLGLAGVSRQEEGQQRVSRGDDIFGNGKHQDALSVYCLWKTSLFVNLLFCIYLLLFSNHIRNFLYPLLSCWCWCFSISCLLVPCFQIPAQQTTPSPAQLHAQQVESRRHCAQEDHEAEYQRALVNIKESVRSVNGLDIKESLQEQIRQWFLECR